MVSRAAGREHARAEDCSLNPYQDLALAAESTHDALRRLASSMPRTPEWQAVMDNMRILALAVRALDRIHTPPEEQR